MEKSLSFTENVTRLANSLGMNLSSISISKDIDKTFIGDATLETKEEGFKVLIHVNLYGDNYSASYWEAGCGIDSDEFPELDMAFASLLLEMDKYLVQQEKEMQAVKDFLEVASTKESSQVEKVLNVNMSEKNYQIFEEAAESIGTTVPDLFKSCLNIGMDVLLKQHQGEVA